MRSETQEKFKGHPWPSGKQFVILLFLHHQVKVIRCPEMLHFTLTHLWQIKVPEMPSKTCTSASLTFLGI